MKRFTDKLKKIWEAISNGLHILFCIVVAVALVSNCGSDNGPRLGDSCGNGNRWRPVGVGPYADMSCEPS